MSRAVGHQQYITTKSGLALPDQNLAVIQRPLRLILRYREPPGRFAVSTAPERTGDFSHIVWIWIIWKHRLGRWCRLRKAAERLGMPLATLRKWVYGQKIEVVYIGSRIKVKEETIEKILARGTTSAREEYRW